MVTSKIPKVLSTIQNEWILQITISGLENVVDLLIQKNANPNIKDNNEKLPIDLATEKGNSHVSR